MEAAGFDPASTSNRVAGQLRASLLDVLNEHHAAAEHWLRERHAALRKAIEQTCEASQEAAERDPRASAQICASTGDARGQSLEIGGTATHGITEAASSVIAQAQNAAVLAVNPLLQGSADGRGYEPLESKGIKPATHVVQPGIPSSLDAKGRQAGSSEYSVDSETIRPTTASSRVMKKSNFMGILKGSTEQHDGSLRGRMRYVVKSPYFDVFIGCLIILNTVVMFAQLELDGMDTDPALHTSSGGHAHYSGFFVGATHFFSLVFCVELIIRFYVYRVSFFNESFNVLDTIIVLATTVETYLLEPLKAGLIENLNFLRLVRIMRVARALRVLRTIRLCQELRILLNTIVMSFMSLFWSMIILCIFMLMSSLFLCQMLHEIVIDDDKDLGVRKWVFRHFGTASRSLFTMFEATFSGCWPNYSAPLIENVHPAYAVFFAVYVTGVVFAVIRIISALFLKDTLQSAANDADVMVQAKLSENRSLTAKLAEIFHEADESGDGFLSLEEFQNILAFPKVKLWMSALGLDTTETEGLFHMLDEEADGKISYDEFVSGIMHLKCNTRSQDTLRVLRSCKQIMQKCNTLQDGLDLIQQTNSVCAVASARWPPSVPRGPAYDCGATLWSQRQHEQVIFTHV